MKRVLRVIRGTTKDAEQWASVTRLAPRVECSELRCTYPVGDDGCMHQPEEPWCALHLRDCSECRYFIDNDYPSGA